MLSAILPRDKSHPTAFSDLNDLVWLQRIVASGHDSVDLDASLLDQPPRFAVRLRKAALNERFEERKDCDVLRLPAVCLLDLATEEKVEKLVGASYLDISVDRDRVVSLVERVKDLVGADGCAFLEAVGEVLPLQHLL